MEKIWSILFAHSSKLTDETKQRKASIASFLLFVFSLLMIVLCIAIPYYLQDYSIYNHHNSVIMTTFVYIICYFLSRTRHYGIAILIWAVLFTFALSNAMISDPKVKTISEASIFLIIIITVCSLTLNFKFTIVFGIFISLLLIALPIINTEIQYNMLFIPGFVIISNTVLAISGAIIIEKNIDEMKSIQMEALENAHKAGMADVAADVLHNVGNVLNSVVTSAYCINERNAGSGIEKLIKARAVLVENKDNLKEFISSDPKGEKLLKYIMLILCDIEDDCKYIDKHSQRIKDKTQIISEIIHSQQKYTFNQNFHEVLQLENIINDSLIILTNSIKSRNVKIIKEYEKNIFVDIQKTKLINVLIHIINNALESMDEIHVNRKELRIKIFEKNNRKFCWISDSGTGIKKGNIEKIFIHGYTTKRNGHGFGLHSCANYMTEMKGSLKVKSDGEGKGSTFILEFI